MKETVTIYVDYESPPAHRVARDVWSVFSRAALSSGLDGITARWESLQDLEAASAGGSSVIIFVVGQDRPETVECVGVFGDQEPPSLYGVVVATPERPSPLSGSLLYQGVGRLTGEGVRAGDILPALVPVSPKTEGEAYARQLLGRLKEIRQRR